MIFPFAVKLLEKTSNTILLTLIPWLDLSLKSERTFIDE